MEKNDFLHGSCEIKSASGLGMKLYLHGMDAVALYNYPIGAPPHVHRFCLQELDFQAVNCLFATCIIVQTNIFHKY